MLDMFGRKVEIGDHFVGQYFNTITVFRVERINKKTIAAKRILAKTGVKTSYFYGNQVCLVDEKYVTNYILRQESLA